MVNYLICCAMYAAGSLVTFLVFWRKEKKREEKSEWIPRRETERFFAYPFTMYECGNCGRSSVAPYPYCPKCGKPMKNAGGIHP